MTKILFVCHGNICRSPMAESVMTHLLQRADRRHPSSGKVKIARGDVYLRMWKAFLFSWKEAL